MFNPVLYFPVSSFISSSATIPLAQQWPANCSVQPYTFQEFHSTSLYWPFGSSNTQTSCLVQASPFPTFVNANLFCVKFTGNIHTCRVAQLHFSQHADGATPYNLALARVEWCPFHDTSYHSPQGDSCELSLPAQVCNRSKADFAPWSLYTLANA